MKTKTVPVFKNNFPKILVSASLALLVSEAFVARPAHSQTTRSNQSNQIGNSSNSNQIMQSNPQLSVTNSNVNEFNYPEVFPLNPPASAPVNTENNWGFNLSTAVNTLDASNVTVSFGVVFQPGRTENHNARMNYIQQRTETLEVKKKIMESNLSLLRKKIQEATLRVQNLQQSAVTPSSNTKNTKESTR